MLHKFIFFSGERLEKAEQITNCLFEIKNTKNQLFHQTNRFALELHYFSLKITICFKKCFNTSASNNSIHKSTLTEEPAGTPGGLGDLKLLGGKP